MLGPGVALPVPAPAPVPGGETDCVVLAGGEVTVPPGPPGCVAGAVAEMVEVVPFVPQAAAAQLRPTMVSATAATWVILGFPTDISLSVPKLANARDHCDLFVIYCIIRRHHTVTCNLTIA